MPRLLPDQYVKVEVLILYDDTIPDTVKATYAQLRGLAWDGTQTPQISFDNLMEITGKIRSTLYGHMAFLRDRHALSWITDGKGNFIVTFTPDLLSENLDGNLSRNLDMPLQLNPPVTDAEINAETKEVKATHKAFEGETVAQAVQKSGQSKKPDASKRKKSTADERTNHPAIQAVFGILGRFPAKHEYDALIEAVGDKPDKPKLRLCWAEWRRPRQGFPNGYSPRNYGWVMDWYVNGLPDSKNGAKPETALDRISRRIENGEEI